MNESRIRLYFEGGHLHEIWVPTLLADDLCVTAMEIFPEIVAIERSDLVENGAVP